MTVADIRYKGQFNMEKKCFVAMPIKKESEGDLFDHFNEVYNDFICVPLEKMGYVVKRGDEDTRGGNVTDHIIDGLANSDLVIVDLTTLNPNVIYEAGIRHTLRKSGTILILDESRHKVEDLPFNFRGLRIVKYKKGYASRLLFHEELQATVSKLLAGVSEPDNIVHKNIPHLLDDVASPKDVTEQNWADRFDRIQTQLRHYIEKFGEIKDIETQGAALSAKERISRIALAAKAGKDSNAIFERCMKSSSESNMAGFVSGLEEIGNLSFMRPSVRQFQSLAKAGESQFENFELTLSVLELALEAHPEDSDLKILWLAQLRQGSKQDRERALIAVESQLGFDRVNKKFDLKNPNDRTAELKVYFDLLLGAGQFNDLIAVCDAFDLQHGASPLMARNRARAIEERDGEEKALPAFKDAALIAGADDTAAIWYGNTLNNMRRFVDAAEVYLLACMRDPADAAGFAHVVQSIARHQRNNGSAMSGAAPRPLPVGVGEDEVKALILAALVCEPTPEERRRIEDAANTLDVSIAGFKEQGEFVRSMNLRKRFELAQSLYEVFRSETTAPSARGASAALH